MQPREFIHILETPEEPPLAALDEQGELLLQLLVHVFCSDGRASEDRLTLIARFLGGRQDLGEAVEALTRQPLDVEALASAFPSSEDRDDLLLLVEHPAWGDSRTSRRAWELVERLALALQVTVPLRLRGFSTRRAARGAEHAVRPGDLLQILRNPDLPPLMGLDEQSELMLILLVHMFFADGRVDDRELAVMSRLLGAEADARGFIKMLGDQPVDLASLGNAFPERKDREDLVLLADLVMQVDDDADARERRLIEDLARTLDVPPPTRPT